jgi:hypothetical protein
MSTFTKHNYTIVIQGPIDWTSMSCIEKYSNFGKVIVSLSNTNNVLLDNNKLISQIKKYAKIIVNEKIILPQNCFNQANILYQALSTYNGLIHVDTEFCIKMRSDEKFTDLSVLLDKHKNNPDKIICSNIFFRKPRHYLYHISDHLICGRTDILLKSFENVKNICSANNVHNILTKFKIIHNIARLVPEQIICLSILQNLIQNRLIDLRDRNTCINLMKTYFDVIDVDSLGEIIISFKDFHRKGIRCTTSSSRFILNNRTDICFSMDEYK